MLVQRENSFGILLLHFCYVLGLVLHGSFSGFVTMFLIEMHCSGSNGNLKDGLHTKCVVINPTNFQ